MTGTRSAVGGDATGRSRFRTLFLGSGRFAVPVLERLAEAEEVEVVAVVSAPDRPAARGQRPTASPVAELARARGWPLIQPERLRAPEVVSRLAGLAPELLVLADYGQLVPQALLEVARHGALNVHPSLLPRHRGATPIQGAILAGDRQTGVTVFRMDAGLDTGPVVAQDRLPLEGSETAPELESRLAALGARLLVGILGRWLAGRIEPRPQPAEGATLTRPLRREDGRIAWSRPAALLERQVRAYQTWPGSWTESPVGRLVLWRVEALPAATGALPGTVTADGRGLAVACADGLLRLLEVRPAGRRRMSGEALRNGHPGLVGTVLG